MSDAQDIWILNGGKREGPFSLAEIEQKLALDEISESALCRRKGESSILRVRDLLAQPDPTPIDFETENDAPATPPVEKNSEHAGSSPLIVEDDDYIYYYEEVTEPASDPQANEDWYFGKLSDGAPAASDSFEESYEEVDIVEDRPLAEHITPLGRVSRELPVMRLLDLFIKRREHMFLVEDEYGQTAGIVTLEDALETLLGREIMDESDTVEDMQELARSRYRGRLRDSQ